MTEHEYPMTPAERDPTQATQTSGGKTAKYWGEMRLDWLRDRMENRCSLN